MAFSSRRKSIKVLSSQVFITIFKIRKIPISNEGEEYERNFFSYVKPYKWTAFIALCLMLLELFVELVQPLIMAKIIDDGVRAQNQGMIFQWGAILLALSFVAFFLLVSLTHIFHHIPHKAFLMIYEMRCLKKNSSIYISHLSKIFNSLINY